MSTPVRGIRHMTQDSTPSSTDVCTVDSTYLRWHVRWASLSHPASLSEACCAAPLEPAILIAGTISWADNQCPWSSSSGVSDVCRICWLWADEVGNDPYLSSC